MFGARLYAYFYWILKTLPGFVKNIQMLKECSICQLGPGNSGRGSHHQRFTTGLVRVSVNCWSKSQLSCRIFNLIFSPNCYVPRPIFTYPFFIGGLNGRGKLLVVLLEFDIYSKSVWSQITAMFPYNLVIDSFREYSNVTYSINITKNFARRDPNPVVVLLCGGAHSTLAGEREGYVRKLANV